MKIITANTNGIRAAARKGFFDWLKEEDADFVCIQETKAQKEQLEGNGMFFPENYYCKYHDAEKKGYSGVAIYSKEKPINIIEGFSDSDIDSEGRYLEFVFKKFSVISLYMHSGTSGDIRQEKKYRFMDLLFSKLMKRKKDGDRLIICGDINIAHTEKDIKNAKGNKKNSGFLPEEREWLTKLFLNGYKDAFRLLNNEDDQYTWWSNRGRAYENNVGWRIDYQIISDDISKNVLSTKIYKEKKFSDHAPLILNYNNLD